MSSSINNPCPFCAPAVNDACFASTENFMAVYNIAPILPGHCLILPKEHVSGFLDISEQKMTEYIVFSRKVIKLLQLVFGAKAFDWTIQEGIFAGQTIDHMHMHIVPRKEGDLPEPGDWYPKLKQKNTELIDSLSRPKFSKEELQIITKNLEKEYNKLF